MTPFQNTRDKRDMPKRIDTLQISASKLVCVCVRVGKGHRLRQLYQCDMRSVLCAVRCHHSRPSLAAGPIYGGGRDCDSRRGRATIIPEGHRGLGAHWIHAEAKASSAVLHHALSPSMPRHWATLHARCWHRPRPFRLLLREPCKKSYMPWKILRALMQPSCIDVSGVTSFVRDRELPNNAEWSTRPMQRIPAICKPAPTCVRSFATVPRSCLFVPEGDVLNLQ